MGIIRNLFTRSRAAGQAGSGEPDLRSVFDAALDAVIAMDARGLVVSWNPRAEAIFGWSREEALGRTVAELIIPPAYRDAHARGLARFLATGSGPLVGRRVEVVALRRDRTEFPVELSIVAIRDREATVFTAFVADITERRQAQDVLDQLRRRYELILNSIADGVYGIDREGTITFVNRACARMLGWDPTELVGRAAHETLHHARRDGTAYPKEESPVLAALMQGGPRQATDEAFWRRDGSSIPVEYLASPMLDGEGRSAGVVVTFRDITERKEAERLLAGSEAALLQSQKMESLGRLAGGVAHDFNNILGVIAGYGELLRRRMPPGPPLGRYVDEILKAGARAAGLTAQLLAFGRRQVLQPRVLVLNEVVGEMETMLRRLIGEDVQMVTRLGSGLGPVRADPGQLGHALMNLVVNARDAMPRGGRLTVETADVRVGPTGAAPAGVGPGRYAALTVTDTGQGMSPEVQAHIFEPFFTTKEAGKGTGLGLATVHGIVEQSGGHVAVESRPDHGAVFTIYLPTVEDAPAAAPPRGSEKAPAGTETVLVVEDEPALREIVRECLEAGGYTVLQARHGAAALELAEAYTDTIHLLLTDVVMPEIGGRQLATRLVALRPDIKVVYMSGYTDDAVILNGVRTEAMPFLEKPFTPGALLAKVREILDRPST
jgi:PAS domain S-box-containing protein